MTPESLEAMRQPPAESSPDWRCGDCWLAPTAPPVSAPLWRQALEAGPWLAPPRCNCQEWGTRLLGDRSRRLVTLPDGGVHSDLCDLPRSTQGDQVLRRRRRLLCLECLERRIGRQVTWQDLAPYLRNYVTAAMLMRMKP